MPVTARPCVVLNEAIETYFGWQCFDLTYVHE